MPYMRSALFPVIAILTLAPFAFSQPAFEVASIKPVDTTKTISNAGVTVYPGGRLVIHALSLKAVIAAAYDIGFWQFSGGDAWMDKDVYDIEGKPAAGTGPYSVTHTRFGIGDAHVREMLQTLLADRFHLKLRRDEKTGPVYLLERSSKPLRLLPTTDQKGHSGIGAPGFSGEIEYVGGHFYVFDTTMPQLAKFAGDNILHKPVTDHTGLVETFYFRDPDAKVQQENSDFEPSFLAFIRDVGLKLTSAQGPVVTFVIEYADKPSAN